MIPKLIEAIEKSDIEFLIASATTERRTLEYKKTLPGNGDLDKKEFFADVISLANASGGDILYGIEALDGVPKKAIGLANLVVDSTTLQLV